MAFAASEVIDSAVFAQLRARSWFRAVVGSNVVGLLVDSVVFVPLAFGSFAAVRGQIVGKSIAAVLTIAVLLTLNACRRTARQ